MKVWLFFQTANCKRIQLLNFLFFIFILLQVEISTKLIKRKANENEMNNRYLSIIRSSQSIFLESTCVWSSTFPARSFLFPCLLLISFHTPWPKQQWWQLQPRYPVESQYPKWHPNLLMITWLILLARPQLPLIHWLELLQLWLLRTKLMIFHLQQRRPSKHFQLKGQCLRWLIPQKCFWRNIVFWWIL